MDGHKLNKKELVPIIALLVFIAVVLILCAVSAGRDADARENTAAWQEEAASQEESAQEETGPEGNGTEGTAAEETEAKEDSTQEGNAAVMEVKKTIELEEDPAETGTQAEAESVAPVLESEPESAAVSANGVSQNDAKPVVKKTNLEMLAEMMDYWSKGNVEAVEDLSRLSHYKAMSASLEGPSYFYYYGDRNADGKPEGTGIAVYGENQYYYGQWVNGVRQGEGTWLKMYDYSDRDTKADRARISHSYTGSWQNDLPNGEGHEQYVIDPEKAEAGSRYLQNAMGNFTNGLYDGKMYLMTQDASGNVQEWYGNAAEGVFETFEGRDSEGRVPICQDAKNPDSHLWIRPLDNMNLGITEVREQATAQKDE